ncbi:hypothetical protein ONZ45_g409 [Pleurotus djamor]|nr:hypothetical protein ONZ45_g409 [Pleurotus djamor]
MIAEVPTICIESVYVWNNTSVIVDEILAQRIGMIPLNADPAPDEQPTDRNTLVFKLNVACTRNPKAPKDAKEPAELYINHEVLSGQMTWEPVGEQLDVFSNCHPAPTNSNIVLTKLRPGQEVTMELHAVKGVGKDHAKFSPVATASYRLLPYIQLNADKPVPPYLAKKFQSCFSPGVIRIDPRTNAVSIDPVAVRDDTVSREVLRHPEFEGCVELKRIRDYFMFNVESESAYPPERLLPEAIRVMRSKIANIRQAAEALRPDVEMAV